MPQLGVSPRLVRFASFEVGLRAGELRKHGRKLRLQEQPLRVLSMLLERPGELVTREELRQQLWPADTFVDFAHGLNSAVARLRESLNDSAEQPQFVETIPRRGYRFIAECQQPEPAFENSAVALPVTPATARPTPRMWVVLTGAVLVFVFVGLQTSGFSTRAGAASPPPPEIVPLAGLAGYEVGPAFSPDGNQVAFTEINGSQNSGIYTSLVGGEESLRLTRGRRDCCVAWSPDGRDIAFLRQRDDQYDIYVVPALGGTERLVDTIPHLLYPALNWSPDGKFLAFPQSPRNSLSSRITLLSLADSSSRQLTSPPEDYVDWGPTFSWDGTQMAFVRGTLAGVANDVFVVPLKGGEPRRLTFNNRPIFGVSWAANGDLIYSSLRGGATELWRVCAGGGTPSLVSGVGLMAFSPTIPRRGNELAYQEAIGKDNIWRIQVKDGQRLPGAATIAIAAKGHKLRPSFSPDGKRIAFESDRLGSMEIWTCDSHGLNCGELTSLHGTAGTARWSPDGRSIAFEFHPGEHAEVYIVDVNSGMPRQLSTIPGADNLAPSWSRDGQWLYFSSKRGREPFQLWKIPVHGGAAVQVTHTGGIAAAESEDGRFLYFSKYEQTGVWRMPLNGGAEVRVVDKPGGSEWFNWGLARNGIYFLDQSADPKPTVNFFDFSNRKMKAVWTLEKPWGWGLAVSSDGGSVLFVQSEYEQSNIMVVKNFR